MNRKLVVLLAVLALGGAVAAAAVYMSSEPVINAAAMAELNVTNLSCGSCVNNIQQALAKVDGVGTADISVTNGRGQVTYDPTRTSSAAIVKAVTDAGYPSTVRIDLSADDYQKLQSESEQLSAAYVARIGSRLLSRDDFSQALRLRRTADLGGSNSSFDSPQLQAQVWKELKEREILLAAADVNKIVVQDEEVNLEIERIKGSNPDFEKTVKSRFGSPEQFFTKVKENMIINRNIDLNVIAGVQTDRDKQLRFTEWYNDTLQKTDVLIFDPAIKQAEASGSSSCGGSCGGSKS
jgi:copper chaperone CopZ